VLSRSGRVSGAECSRYNQTETEGARLVAASRGRFQSRLTKFPRSRMGLLRGSRGQTMMARVDARKAILPSF